MSTRRSHQGCLPNISLPTFHHRIIFKMKLQQLFWSLWALLASLFGIHGLALTSSVRVSDGPINGNPRNAQGILSFKGIPFAQPPVGDLRWTSPAPPTPWKCPLNATNFGATCWNNLIGGPVYTPFNEDCLTINVWTGAQDSNEKRPVMLWVYGGGFQFGSSADPLYDGGALAEQGVVLISFNYRLGVFGHLGLAELDEEGTYSGDYGLQDQIAALKWVQENAAFFGGDPSRVTIFGESAGAHAIGILMASPLASGLFSKAIMESGSWWDRNHGSLTTFDEARQYGLDFETKLGVSNVAQLRALSAETLNKAQPYNINNDPGVSNFAPSIDKYVLPRFPGEVFHNGQEMKIPLLAGFNAVEQYLFYGLALPHCTTSQFESAAEILFSDKLPKFLALYPDTTPEMLNASSDALIGDLCIRQQTWEAADTHQKAGNNVYFYFYNYTSAYEPIASHTAEESFVFGNLLSNPVIQSFSPPTNADKRFSEQVMAYWTNFAKNGNPNGQGLQNWPQYDSSNKQFLQLGNTIAPIHYDLSRYEFIAGLRTDGVLPMNWRNLNVSASTEPPCGS